jgi:hypothetical protein
MECTIPEALGIMVDDMTNDSALMDSFSKLSAIQRTHGFKTLGYAIQYLIKQTIGQQHKIADVKTIIENDIPYVLTSPPKTGKTTFCKQLIKALEGTPVLVVDVNGEYLELKDIGYGFYNIDFAKSKEHMRFVPNPYSVQKSVEDLFEHLDRVKYTLKPLTLIAEEAQTFSDLAIFCKMLGSARHFLSGFIAVTPLSNISSFQGIEVLIVNKLLTVESVKT